MKKVNKGIIAYKSDIGKVRQINEDYVSGLISSNGVVLLYVCDGMGGSAKGDFASNYVSSNLALNFKIKNKFNSFFDCYTWLNKELKVINKYLFNKQDNDIEYKGMGTTLTLALIYKKKLIVINCGDSRCYLLNDSKLELVTEDQTYVNYLVKSGQISEKEALTHPKKHYLINAIGLFPTLSYDIKIFEYKNQNIFLCSDGLYNSVSKLDIEANLNTNKTPSEKIDSLINLANFNSGIDNISCVLWESQND